MHENIREGNDVFLQEGGKGFGAVRQVRKHELVVYVENAGDFEVPLAAVKDAEYVKRISQEQRDLEQSVEDLLPSGS